MQKVWQIKPRTKPDLASQLLENRGIFNPEDAADFLHPSYAKLHDPFLFRDMHKAVERIWQAITDRENILIYSDYDADAVTSNAVLYRMFSALGVRVSSYIPDRFSEGYGLNLEAFQKIKDQGISLVITVDCGTNSTAEADFCAANGIDLIITDHHEITGEIPRAYAVVNPKRPGETYPYHELTGVGVAFKLASAVLSQKELYAREVPEAGALPEGYEKWLLDLVAIGTVADCHSLIGENRILVSYGLRVLAKTKWVGLHCLLQLANARAPFDTYTLGFIVAPRINAAGRIEHASAAFDLLASDDPATAMRLAQDLERLNQRRQMLTENVMSEARTQLAVLDEQRHKILLAVGRDWPKGVVGLVAGKLCEEYAKPVLVLERGDAEATGSARSIPAFNIVEALNGSKHILVKYGGHAAAAGFTLKTEHIDLFYKNLLDFAEQNLQDADLAKVVAIEAEVEPGELSLETAEAISAFEPFGVGNPRPRLALRGVRLVSATAVGKELKHLQMTVSGGQRLFKCIAFNFGKAAESLRPGETLDLAVELLVDSWNGSKSLKLRVIDFKRSEEKNYV